MDLSNEFSKVLDDLGERFGIAIDWSNANVMPYIQELGQRVIRYEIATSIAWMCISLLIIGLSIWAFKKCYDDNDLYFIPIISGFATVVFSICFLTQAFDIIQCLTFPELIWRDYLTSLTRQLGN